MSKHNKSQTKKFSYTPTQELPKLPKKIPTEWNMKGHFYKSVNDPQIEKDVVTTENAITSFVKKFKNSAFTSDATVLKNALDELNVIDENPAVAKPGMFLGLLLALDSGNEAANKKVALLGQRLTKASNELLFFGLELAKVNKKQQESLLKDPLLTDYTYYLKGVFENAKHHLSEAEEKILRLLSDCSYDMWVDATDKMIGRMTIKYKGQEIPVNEAYNLVNSLPFKEQPKLWKLFMQEISTIDQVVENELTAICTKKKIDDELRGYKHAYSSSVISKEDDEKSVDALIQAVSTTGFTLSKKFYKLKAKLHGVDKLEYGQRNASLSKAPTVDFTQATEICRDVFYGVDKEYGAIFDTMLVNGQIDAYPKRGKDGGAFCASDPSQSTMVLLNHVNTLSSLETYAHEMGHAIHAERAKTQPAHYQKYSLTTAETASTLFEGLLFDAVLAQAKEADKVTLIHDKLIRDTSTIQRQIACFKFELDMHNMVREQGGITRKDLNQLMQKNMKAYLGPAIDVTELDGNFYVFWSHIRYGFYVYTYSFGKLMSCVMAEKFAADNGYADKIDTFLTAGGSDNVANIFKSIGINTKKVATFEYGLQKMSNEITQLQKLTK